MFLLSKFLFRFSFFQHQTIYALSSGLNTAISIIRISGEKSANVLNLIHKETLKKKILQNPRKLHFTRFFNQQNKIIDEGLIVYFPKQSSYNNEDIFQLHLHGSKAVVHAMFKSLNQLCMRQANRGQITKRAVINGKLSLHQAEAINDLINSQSQFVRQISINNILGKNVMFLDQLKQQLVGCLAKSQAYIDFNEDESDVKETLFEDTKGRVKSKIMPKLKSLLQNYKNLQIIKDGVTVVIIGRPNVGKSTLINLLSKKQIAIVSQRPGTTRDIIQTAIQINGFRINLIDTAGLRQSNCQIQSLGIKKAKQKIKESQIKLVLIDLNQEKLYIDEQRRRIIIDLQQNDAISKLFNEQQAHFIINKSDLIQQKYKNWQILIQSKKLSELKKVQVLISAQNNQNTQFLQQFLTQQLNKNYGHYLNSNQIFFTRQRYFNHLTQCQKLLNLYLNEERVDFACEYLRQSIKQVKQIFGRVDCEDVLDVVFRDFCIGK